MLCSDGSVPLYVRVCPCTHFCVLSLGGFPFRRPWGPELGVYVPSSKVDRMDTTEPATSNRYHWRIKASEQGHLS